MISRRNFLRLLAALGAAALVPLYGGIEPLFTPRVARYQVRPQRWSEGLSLTIAVLTDIHACEPWMTADRIRSVVDATNRLGADVIVLLGDFSAGHHFITGLVPSDEWSKALGGLKAPLGVHAILGNHDWWDDKTVQLNGKGLPYGKDKLENVGIRVYHNEAARLTKEGQAFWLAGLGDQLAFWPSQRQRPQQRIGTDDLQGTLAQVVDDAPVILLAHEPDVMVRVPDRVSLLLSGHTHGGQVRLFGWSPVVPSRYGNRYAYGHIREQCDLIVSSGLGCAIVPFRLGVPPEIALVKLG
jgi:predicted MPP superfamily phosphohydrolase